MGSSKKKSATNKRSKFIIHSQQTGKRDRFKCELLMHILQMRYHSNFNTGC